MTYSYQIPSLDAGIIRPTTIIKPARLRNHTSLNITLASETFQHTGSFKFRAAYNLVSKVENDLILGVSSGNFGQALAYACALLGKRAIIVMPHNSARVKVDAVREYGATVEFTDVRVKSRAERVAEVYATNPTAYIASAYDDYFVIEGNASLGLELFTSEHAFDVVVAPLGGGGLTAGLIIAAQASGRDVEVWGAEPLLANDAARSLRAGHIVANESEPQTIADGTRTLSLGKRNWEILQNGLAGIVEVPEEKIESAVRQLFNYANLKVEPTGALSLAALLHEPERFAGKSVCCVVSGGNVDADLFARIISQT